MLSLLFQAGILSHYVQCVVVATNAVHSGAEERATKALAMVAKMIQRINLYEKMLSQHQIINQLRCEVEVAFGKAAGTEAEAATFSKTEDTFLSVLKAKTDFIFSAEETKKSLTEALEKEKVSHVVDVENANKAKNDMEEEPKGRIQALEEQLAAFEVVKLKAENQRLSSNVEKFKKGYTNSKQVVYDFVMKAKEKARESFAEGFYLTQKQILDGNPEVDLFGLDGRVCPPCTPE